MYDVIWHGLVGKSNAYSVIEHTTGRVVREYGIGPKGTRIVWRGKPSQPIVVQDCAHQDAQQVGGALSPCPYCG